MEQDNRADQRRRTLKSGKIRINNGFSTFECTVRNMSDTGALLKVASVIGIPDTFELVMADGQKFACKAVRRTATEIGVSFD